MQDDVSKNRRYLNIDSVWTIDGKIKFRYVGNPHPFEIRSYSDYYKVINPTTGQQDLGRDGYKNDSTSNSQIETLRLRQKKLVLPKLNNLKICVWNFNGFRSSKAQLIKQSGNDFFNNILKKNDLICFSETWRKQKDNSLLDLDRNFTEFHESGLKNHLGGRPSGGMSLMVRKSILKHVLLSFQTVIIFGAGLKKMHLAGKKIYLFVALIFLHQPQFL